ncbi:hypothetical protein J2767_003596 [Agrobacterium tumefaciens]|uniref:DUF2971 domain-containing protein n=1 Tax=Agrobacterium tumefaciens TaxID=358 RepID=UPI001AE8048D|nr:DUF2971 domain-containing protein [Agrobacterium tumefaciens]MBP2572418.1 hypothetical protein [Agrobacterium tumefaciens]
MRLYYFTSQPHGIEAIKNTRLKVSRFSQLNDTSELRINVTNKTDKRAQQEQFEAFDRQGGILCMTANWSDTRMWGHYADNHKGMALIFDADPEYWFPILYISDRLRAEAFGKNRYRDLTARDHFAIGMTKSDKWQYENEARRYLPLDDCEHVDELHFSSFELAKVSFVGALLGARANIGADDLEYMKRQGHKVGFMKHSDNDFRTVLDCEKTNGHANQVTFHDLYKDVVDEGMSGNFTQSWH